MTKLAPNPTGADVARIALRAACSVEGVVGPAPASAHVSRPQPAAPPADETQPGGGCTRLPDGTLRVELHLVAGMVALPELAERVRDQVEQALARAGLSEKLASIDVAFDDIDPAGAPRRRRRRSTRQERRP